MPPDPTTPYIYAVAGNDSRKDGPFKMFGFRDDGTDTQISASAGTPVNGVTPFNPVALLHQHQRQVVAGVPVIWIDLQHLLIGLDGTLIVLLFEARIAQVVAGV